MREEETTVQKDPLEKENAEKPVPAESCLDPGGKQENSEGMATSTGSNSSRGIQSGRKKPLLVLLIALIAVVAIIGAWWILSGGGGQPEDAVYQFLGHINNGEYDRATDLLVEPGTLQPLSENEKASLVHRLEAMVGPGGIKISGIKILSEQKVNDNQYLIRVSVTGSMDHNGQQETATLAQTVTIVYVNGQWKIVEGSIL
jgi:hypothetical protein